MIICSTCKINQKIWISKFCGIEKKPSFRCLSHSHSTPPSFLPLALNCPIKRIVLNSCIAWCSLYIFRVCAIHFSVGSFGSIRWSFRRLPPRFFRRSSGFVDDVDEDGRAAPAKLSTVLLRLLFMNVSGIWHCCSFNCLKVTFHQFN